VLFLIADSNALRHDGLRQYLEASRNHAVALSDLTMIEMRKNNALSTSRSSLKIITAHLDQTFLLKPTHLILEQRISSEADTALLFDYAASADLDRLCRALQRVPMPDGLAAHMGGMEVRAREQIRLLHQQVAELEPGMIEAASDFTQEELRQIRTGSNIADGTRDKLFVLLKETTAEFIRRNQPNLRRAGNIRLREAMGLFAFRYSLCMLLYYMRWVKGRRQRGVSRVNDVVDMQKAAMATFFNGLLSGDGAMQEIAGFARTILRSWGAYVGDDFIAVPASGQAHPE